MRPPRHFREFLRWFMEGYDLETPDALHTHDVWVGRPQEDLPPEHVGGSLIGTPKYDDGFRRLMENSPRETDRDDDAFVRPMRAALAELRHSSPFMAEALTRMANGASIEEAAMLFTRDAPHLAAEIVIAKALERLFDKYRVDPEPRNIRTEKPDAA
jgi:hypothetical protein